MSERFSRWHTVYDDGSIICPFGGCTECQDRPRTLREEKTDALTEEIYSWLQSPEGQFEAWYAQRGREGRP